MSVTLKLSKPITAHGQEVSELTFADPTSKDVIELGFPYLVVIGADGQAATEFRSQVVAKYITKLAAIPAGAVQSLAVSDLNACVGVVMGFFGEGDGEAPESSSTAPSISPTSGG